MSAFVHFSKLSAAIILCLCSSVFAYSGGSGEPNDPYLIATPADLNSIGGSIDLDKCFKLVADINMAGFTGTQYNIIGTLYTGCFEGTFDGDGHVIRNLTYTSTFTYGDGYWGLFGLTVNATIKNLGIENVNISMASGFVGGLIGRQDGGSITNCYTTGSISGASGAGGLVGTQALSCSTTNCYSECSVSGASSVGGLMGSQSGTMTNCHSTGTVTVTSASYAGGLAGGIDGNITNCYSTGAVNCSYSFGSDSRIGGLTGCQWSGNITKCYSTGAVVKFSGSGTYSYAGGLIGYKHDGTVTNCYSMSSVYSFDSLYTYAGGLIGYLYRGTVANSYSMDSVTAATSVSGSRSYAGGLVGYHDSGGGAATITDCYSTSSVTSSSANYSYAGGLMGFSRANIKKCYSTGNVSATGTYAYKGGLLGYGWATGCFWDTQTSGVSYGVGDGPSSGVIGRTTAEMQTQSTFTGAFWDFADEVDGIGDWVMPESSYPKLGWEVYPLVTVPDLNGATVAEASQILAGLGILLGESSYYIYDLSAEPGLVAKTNPISGTSVCSGLTKVHLFIASDSNAFGYSGGDGTAENPYQIASPWDWQKLMVAPDDWNENFILMENLYLEGVTLTSVGNSTTKFTGVFNGNDHFVCNMGISLFGYLDGAQISNLGIRNMSITNGGGLFGYSSSSVISNCYAIGTVTGSSYTGGLGGRSSSDAISSCYANGTVTSSNFAGGLLGSNTGGIITNSYATGTVVASSSSVIGGLVGSNTGAIAGCHTTSTVNGFSSVGGLVGANTGGTITDSHAIGDVNGINSSSSIGGLVGSNTGKVTGCNSISTVKGRSSVGGLVGTNTGGTIIGSYAAGDVNGINSSVSSNIGGLVGLNENRGVIYICYATNKVRGWSSVGGLVGYNSLGSTITSSYASGNVSGLNSSLSNYIGGLVGQSVNGSTINNCYATGTIAIGNSIGGLVGYFSNGTIYSSYATGTVNGGFPKGGFIGRILGGTINASFWDTQTSGTSDGVGNVNPDPNGVMGKTTEQMQTLTTFTDAGWDFSYTDGDEADWFMADASYPILTWQISPVDIYTDGKNNFKDFTVFAKYWLREDCRMYNNFCEFSDMDFDGDVDIDDLAELMSYWLENGIY